jgi:protein TonB
MDRSSVTLAVPLLASALIHLGVIGATSLVPAWRTNFEPVLLAEVIHAVEEPAAAVTPRPVERPDRQVSPPKLVTRMARVEAQQREEPVAPPAAREIPEAQPREQPKPVAPDRLSAKQELLERPRAAAQAQSAEVNPPVETAKPVDPAPAIDHTPTPAQAPAAVVESDVSRLGNESPEVTELAPGVSMLETEASPPTSSEPGSRTTGQPGDQPGPVAEVSARAVPGDGITQTAVPRGGYQVRPPYPATARRLGIQGTTVLRLYVDAEGRVADVAIERSAGHQDLDHAAAQAVRRWRFEPGRRGREPIGMWVLLPVEFRLR